MCGFQLDLVEAAHIVPVTHDQSTDETANGLCLCGLHHKAYDIGLVIVEKDYRVCINQSYTADLKERLRDQGLNKFNRTLRDFISVPPESRLRPKADYLEIGQKLRIG